MPLGEHPHTLARTLTHTDHLMNQTALSRALLIAAAALGLQSAGAATVLDLSPNSDGFSWDTEADGTVVFEARSIYLRANETFTIDQLSWFGGVVANSYEFVISAGLGEENGSIGAVLASASASLPAGAGPQSIDIDFTFQSGAEYVINFRPVSEAYGFGGPYGFHYSGWGNGSEEADLGLVTLLDGREGFNSDSAGNSWTTHFAMNVVPEPSSSLLGLVGLCGIVLRRRRA
jgi:MYXO-CTERM domain-containing protein